MSYVDGFVVPVPEGNLKQYRTISQKAGKIWKEHGALQYVEAVGDDLDVQFGASLKKVIKPKPGETILFSFMRRRVDAQRFANTLTGVRETCPVEVAAVVSSRSSVSRKKRVNSRNRSQTLT